MTTRRIITFLLCAVLLLCLLPVQTAEASSYYLTLTVKVEGQPLVGRYVSGAAYVFQDSYGFVKVNDFGGTTDGYGRIQVECGMAGAFSVVVNYDDAYTADLRAQDGGYTRLTDTNSEGSLTASLLPTKGILRVADSYGVNSDITYGDTDASIGYTVTGPGNYSTSFTLNSTNGYSKDLTRLTPGTYTVTENSPAKQGYQLGVAVNGTALTKDASGNYSARFTVSAGATTRAAMVNTYTNTTTAAMGRLCVTQTYGGTQITSGSTSFTVTGPGNYSTTFTLDASNSYTRALTRLTPGAYTVTQNDPSKWGYILEVSADSTPLTAVGGGYSKTYTIQNGSTVMADFVNTYTASTDVGINIKWNLNTTQTLGVVGYGTTNIGFVNALRTDEAVFYTKPGAVTAILKSPARTGYTVVVTDGGGNVLTANTDGDYTQNFTATTPDRSSVMFDIKYTSIYCSFRYDYVSNLPGTASVTLRKPGNSTVTKTCEAVLSGTSYKASLNFTNMIPGTYVLTAQSYTLAAGYNAADYNTPSNNIQYDISHGYNTRTLTAGESSNGRADLVYKSRLKAITAFSVANVSGTIDEAAGTIALSLPYGTNRQALAAAFTVSSGAAVKVGNTTQTSGTTTNNFTNPVTYTVKAEDGSTRSYVVTVSLLPGPIATSSPGAQTASPIEPPVPPVTASPVPVETDISVVKGEDVTLEIPLPEGCSCQWYVENGGGFVPLPGETGKQLTLPAVSKELDGEQYLCDVSNDGGTVQLYVFSLKVSDSSGLPSAGDAGSTLLWSLLALIAGFGLTCGIFLLVDKRKHRV